uniref:DUF1713 domain-containing protein n=1 Tax=Rhabditophanes sp. KR3021 TaxID=114890 RepID=A0AC35TS41_9BILA
MLRTLLNKTVARGLATLSSNPSTGLNIPLLPPTLPRLPNLGDETSIDLNKINLILPGHLKGVKIYSFPTIVPRILEAPSSEVGVIEKIDPTINGGKVIENPNVITGYSCSPRLLTIRRKKMKKHKRRKRYDRDFFKYQKYHREKKIKAERKFRQQMDALTKDVEEFNPMAFVTETIATAKQEWKNDLAPTGRKKYPHWSQLMAIEELYGLENQVYIDKRFGYPGEEGAHKSQHLMKEYLKYEKDPKK